MISEKLEKIIIECSKRNIPVSVECDNNELKFLISGFAKSGTVRLSDNEVNNNIFVEARYGEINEINNFDELVSIAFDWFERFKSDDTFLTPEKYWVEDFIRLKYLKPVQVK